MSSKSFYDQEDFSAMIAPVTQISELGRIQQTLHEAVKLCENVAALHHALLGPVPQSNNLSGSGSPEKLTGDIVKVGDFARCVSDLISETSGYIQAINRATRL